ncbi:MAG: TorF family putative porin [Pseudomonadales bacterium]
MKLVTKLVAAATLLAGATFTTTAAAEVSYNIGYMSEYHFRGIKQKGSSASAGIDYENGGFYIGSWAADVGDGLEIDYYLGYGIETESGFTASLGYTYYDYTGETFDDYYSEVNINLGYNIFGLEYSFGEAGNFGPELDYDFLALSFALENGWWGTYGTFGDDFDGDYVEIGWGTTVSEIDLGVSAIFADDDLAPGFGAAGTLSSPGDNEVSLVFTVGKSF